MAAQLNQDSHSQSCLTLKCPLRRFGTALLPWPEPEQHRLPARVVSDNGLQLLPTGGRPPPCIHTHTHTHTHGSAPSRSASLFTTALPTGCAILGGHRSEERGVWLDIHHFRPTTWLQVALSGTERDAKMFQHQQTRHADNAWMVCPAVIHSNETADFKSEQNTTSHSSSRLQ